MADILLSELETKECELSVWNRDESNCRALFRPEHTMTLTLANHREGTWPWYSDIEFESSKAWFQFVRLVNDMNRLVKKLPKDEWGFPILPKGGVKAVGE